MVAIADLPHHRPRPADAKTALGGMRVIDFTHFLAGPMCTLILADFGAEVIKIENADRGDDFRGMKMSAEVGGEGGPFLFANRNKRSVGLDLSRPEGREVVRGLIAGADIVVENFSAGVMKRLGLDYPTVSVTNPGLIYCSIGAYGRDGALAHRAGFDPVAQAEGGLMAVNGHADAAPVAIGTPVVDISTGMSASIAVLAAIAARLRHGAGQYVEVNLFDQAVAMLAYLATNTLITGNDPVRAGNLSAGSVPVGVFEASDAPMYLCCANDRTYHRLATDVLGRPELATDPDYATAAARVRNRAALVALLRAAFATAPRATWLAKMHVAGVPVGAVASVREAMNGAEIRERGLLSQLPRAGGAVPHIAPPFRLGATPVVDPVAAPTVGQHTDAVLREALGLDDAGIAALAATGALGTRRAGG